MNQLIPLAHGALGNLDEIAALGLAGFLAIILLAPLVMRAFGKKDEAPPPTESETPVETEDHSPLS